MRPEYKVAIYTRYALPSLMYHLTVHTLHQGHLEELDMVSQKFLKKWLGIPARGCTSAGIFSPAVLAVKPVSQVYLEGHLGAYVNSSLVADPDTREALKCAEEREGAWTRKSSTVVQCRDITKEMKDGEDCFIPTSSNTNTFAQTVRVQKAKMMTIAKKKVTEIYKKKSEEKASQLGFQGQMLSLLAQEEEDIAWKSCIYRVPRGVMAWAVRASTNTLATPDNLARWGRPVDLKCSIEGCTATNTLGHILSNCNKALDPTASRQPWTESVTGTRG